MNRWIWPAALMGAVAVATAAATFVGAQPVPALSFAASETRASVVCPAFRSPTAEVRVAAVATGAGLRRAAVTSPAAGTDLPGFGVASSPASYLRVSALLPDPFGATTVVSAQRGADRGLAATACAVAATDHWFPGVDLRPEAQSEVVVANLDGTPASVDLTAYGERGRITAPRGLRVEPNSVRTLSLSRLERSSGPVTVEVSSSDGRVAAFVRQRTWRDTEPLGADWLPAGTAPATRLVVPGLPSGEGARLLVVTNPGDRTATVTLGGLTKDGPAVLVGAPQLEVPAQSTRTIDLEPGLDAQPGALVLDSAQPVTAGVWMDAGAGDARHDPAYTAATPPLPSDSVWPLAGGKDAGTVLQLANPGSAEASVTVAVGAGEDLGASQEVRIPAGSIAELGLPREDAIVVRLQTGAAEVRGALVSTQRLGKVHGLTVLNLAGEETRAESQVVFDPRAGS